jgi:hypothetical protein
MASEQDTIDAVDRLIAGRWHNPSYEPGDLRGQRRWATTDEHGHVIEVNWEGMSALTVTDDWLEHLAAFPHLELAHLDYNPLKGDGLRHLRGLSNLKGVNLWATEVGDEALEHLAGIESLEWLRLNETEVGDAGLRHVAGLRRLRGLELYKTSVTDAGLLHLGGLERLEFLELSATRVTENSVRQIQAALPHCEISSSWTA